MSLELYDIQASILGCTSGTAESVTPDELISSASRLNITRTLVRRAPEIGGSSDQVHANDLIYAACEAHPSLVPCPIVIPNSGYDLPEESEQVASAIDHGATAVWVRCGVDHWYIADWVSDRLFTALSERRMPVYMSAEMVDHKDLAGLAGKYPEIPFIYAEIGYRDQRTVLPLAEAFPNVHISIGNPFNVHMGIEQLAAKIGAARILFGSGFPASEQTAAATYLMYSAVSDEEKAMIGGRNMERLAAAIKR